MRVRIAAPLCNFNPRSHERSDSNGLMMFDDTLISIHAPTRGATILCNHRGLVFGFQSTLPREERPKPFIYKALRTIISIHAPTRGATKC